MFSGLSRATVNILIASNHLHFTENFAIRSLSTAMTNVTRTPTKVVYAYETPEGMGATVRRSIGTQALRNLSPFLMLDHATINVEDGAGFPDHPHRGQTTVSYVLSGALHHEDFLGNTGTLAAGDLQWMTAGRGIMHSEMPLFEGPNPVPAEALQLWIDLPADQKMIEPSYQEKKAAEIDTVNPQPGVQVTVISGEAFGVKGFVRPVGGCWFLDFKLTDAGASVFQPLPEGWTGFAYVITGALQVGEEATPVDKFNSVVLSAEEGQNGVLLTRPEGTTEDTRFVLIAGEPLDQPVVQAGPFVLTSRQKAMEAYMDFQLGKNGFEGAPGWESKIGAPLRRANSR